MPRALLAIPAHGPAAAIRALILEAAPICLPATNWLIQIGCRALPVAQEGQLPAARGGRKGLQVIPTLTVQLLFFRDLVNASKKLVSVVVV